MRMPRNSTFRDVARLLTMFLVAATVAAYLGGLGSEEYGGRAVVLDGDSLRIDGHEVRLAGIDAPEFGQICQDASNRDFDCGERAKRELQQLAAAGDVACSSTREDRYGRALAECLVEGSDFTLNETMVRNGWAVDYGGYPGVEFNARRDGVGLWAGSFDLPEDYRARARGRSGDNWFMRLLGGSDADG